MPYGDPDIWDWLKLGAGALGAAGGAGAFGGAAGAVPGGTTMSGADLGGNLSAGTLTPPPDFGSAGIPGQPATPWNPTDNLGLPGGGQPGPPSPIVPPAPKLSPLPPARSVTAPVTPPDASATPAAPTDPYPQTPLTADAVNATTASSDPRSWWQRNIGDAWDKAWKEDPKTGISPAQKALAGFGQQAVTAAKGPEAPKFAAVSGGAYKPTTTFNAAQMALSREQQLALLKQRATLSAPWLRREQRTAGLMG
jgi:hypothetical protein